MKKSDTTPLPGSLNTTAAMMREAGAEVMVHPADLLERGSLGAAAALTLERWGSIDLVVHNRPLHRSGSYGSHGRDPCRGVRETRSGKCVGALVINRVFLPAMLKQGGGTIIYITSGAAYHPPPAPAGKGGWGLSYGMSKAAGHMIAPLLNVEYGDQGIRAFNVQPGAIRTERILQDMAEFGFGRISANLVRSSARSCIGWRPHRRRTLQGQVHRGSGVLLPEQPATKLDTEEPVDGSRPLSSRGLVAPA